MQMMCDEQGLFLEIAQVIRRLELTILKGELETRSDNTWAHFIVEVSLRFSMLSSASRHGKRMMMNRMRF